MTVSTTRREARLVKNEIRGLVIPGSDQIGRSARTIQIGGDFAELFGPKSQGAESESQIIGKGSKDIFHFRNYGNEEMMCEDSSSAILRPQRLRSKN